MRNLGKFLGAKGKTGSSDWRGDTFERRKGKNSPRGGTGRKPDSHLCEKRREGSSSNEEENKNKTEQRKKVVVREVGVGLRCHLKKTETVVELANNPTGVRDR